MATKITKTLMLNLYSERLVVDPIYTGNRIYAYLDASLHETYGDTVVWCDV